MLAVCRMGGQIVAQDYLDFIVSERERKGHSLGYDMIIIITHRLRRFPIIPPLQNTFLINNIGVYIIKLKPCLIPPNSILCCIF